MWNWFLGLWKAHQGSRAAVAAVAPFVERSRVRFSGIPGVVWLDPYIVGFMVMLITLVAKREAAIGGGSALHHAQSTAWAAITGLKSDVIGEEVLLLSAGRQRDFEQGCRQALAFGQALYGTAATADADLYEAWEQVTRGAPLAHADPVRGLETEAKERHVSELWSELFDTAVSRRLRAG